MGTYTMAQALQLTVLGLSIVFAVLAIIWLTLVVFGYFAKRVTKEAETAQKKTNLAETSAKAAAPAASAAAAVTDNSDNEDEIAAVIAAISALIGTSPLKVSVVASEWKPNFSNKINGGLNNAKFYSKNKWKNI